MRNFTSLSPFYLSGSSFSFSFLFHFLKRQQNIRQTGNGGKKIYIVFGKNPVDMVRALEGGSPKKNKFRL